MGKGSVVGGLACQKDSYLRTLETEVVSCEPYLPPTSNAKKNGTKTEGTEQPKEWMVEFADSVLFPEGGGQPCDHGTVYILGQNSIYSVHQSVERVERHGLRCIVFLAQEIKPGTRVSMVVDFDRRWDLMQQHSGQHLLSAVLDKIQVPTLSWGMGAPVSKGSQGDNMNYVELPRRLTEAEMDHVQDRCVELIQENLPISVELPQNSITDSLPDDYDTSQGIVRFIKIGTFDYGPCCGTHMKQTSHLSAILLHHLQTVRGTNCRLYFSVGDRALRLSRRSINGLRSVGGLLSSGSGAEEVETGVQRLLEQASEARRREKRLLTEVAQLYAQQVKVSLRQHEVSFLHRAEGDLEFANLVIAGLAEGLQDIESSVAVICTGQRKRPGTVMIVGSNSASVQKTVDCLRACVSSVKGGGGKGPWRNSSKWQGKVTQWEKGELEAFQSACEAVDLKQFC